MLLRPAILLAICLAIVGCGRSEKTAIRRYDVRGIVRSIAPDRSTVDVEHEEIRGFMPSMTMPFTPRDAKEIANLRINDAIAFRIEVTDSNVWMTNVRQIAASDLKLPSATPTAAAKSAAASLRVKEGDVMPVFDLTNERGEHVSVETYRGRPFVLTFIFTRCPMPNFCPRMSNNFAELQTAIQHGTGALAETRLLSITLDPQYDTPGILKQYGEHAGADPKIWNFATGAPSEIDDLTHAFAVYRQNESGTISHGLTTALVDANGTVVKIARGNGWTPEEFVAAINQLAR